MSDKATDIAAVIRKHIVDVLLQRSRVPESVGDLLATEIVERAKIEAGGQLVWFGVPGCRRDRDQKMLDAFDARRASHSIGDNMRITAKEFDVSERTVRRVCCEGPS